MPDKWDQYAAPADKWEQYAQPAQPTAAAPASTAEPGNHGLSEFLTSPHGFIREGARQIGQGAKELFTPGQRMRGATDVIRGAGSTLAPVAIGAAIPALASAPAATLGGAALGAGGAMLGSAGGSKLVKGLGGGQEAQDLGGEVGGMAGGILGGGAGAKLMPKAVSMIPSTARAGQNFDIVKAAAKNTPVDLTQASIPALRAQALAKAGATSPKVMNDFLQRIPQHSPQPMLFPEARDFEGNASRLSVDDKIKTNPPMGAQVKQLAKTLADANTDAANRAGQGPLYKSAVDEYRRAMMMRQGAKNVGKIAIPAALGAAGYKAYKLFGGE